MAGTAVGAGMLAMPLEAADIWYTNAIGALLLCWGCMNVSARMILEANLHFPTGSSFETFAPVLLSPLERTTNTMSVIFVHFILTYAYISGGGALVAATAAHGGGVILSPATASLVFTTTLVLPIVHSSRSVERVSTLMMAGMSISFLLSMSGLAPHVSWSNLLHDWHGVEPGKVAADALDVIPDMRPHFNANVWRILPSMLTAFGVHGNVPSMYKLYGRRPAVIVKTIAIGLGVPLAIYYVWLTVVLGVLGPTRLSMVAGVDDLLDALADHAGDSKVRAALQLFGHLALASSFLGVGLGLFDFVADALSSSNRFYVGAAAFVPPMLVRCCTNLLSAALQTVRLISLCDMRRTALDGMAGRIPVCYRTCRGWLHPICSDFPSQNGTSSPGAIPTEAWGVQSRWRTGDCMDSRWIRCGCNVLLRGCHVGYVCLAVVPACPLTHCRYLH